MDRIKDNPYVMPFVGGILFDDKDKKSISMTKQSFTKESDINYIIEKFTRTGLLGDEEAINARKAVFADVSNISDYHSALNLVDNVKKQFDLLPGDIRFKFDNDPIKLLEFVNNPENGKECVELGLLPKNSLTPEPAEVVPAGAAGGNPVSAAVPVAPAAASPSTPAA